MMRTGLWPNRAESSSDAAASTAPQGQKPKPPLLADPILARPRTPGPHTPTSLNARAAIPIPTVNAIRPASPKPQEAACAEPTNQPTIKHPKTMKTLTALLAGTLLLAGTAAQARILRVNNVAVLATSCTTCFQTLPGAIDYAIDGDTIHVEPSDNHYGTATVNKRLVIIGNGYKLEGAGSNPGLQATTKTSRVLNLTIGANSGGTQVIGLHFVSGNGSGLTITGTQNIALRRNHIQVNVTLAGGSVSDILIAENYMTGVSQSTNVNTAITNLTIRNNWFGDNLELNDPGDVVTNVQVLRNTFYYNGNHGLRNAVVAFNSFYAGNVTGNNNDIHDNISAAALTGGDPSNMVVSMSNVYNLSVGSDDTKWDIVSTSPYDEAGPSPRGMYSGTSPYKPSGIPPVPAIYQLLSTVETTPGGGPIQVTLSTRSND